MARILIVDDDPALQELLAEYLQGEGFEVAAAEDAGQAEQQLAAAAPAVIVLDVMLPGRNGFELLREIRREHSVPVLMLTARGDDTDTVVGLELGADDYLAKPCNPRVLLARIRALLRRAQPPSCEEASVLRAGDLELDWGRRQLLCQGEPVTLTGAEMAVLAVLLRHAGEVVSRERLSEEALHRPLGAYDRAIDTHISNLRRKLGPLPESGPRIISRRGAGYQLISADAPAGGSAR
ncbi:response regulator transcription factor [Halorhodospira halophila]|uniref:response regulator transcription factor n=1 Tax=Halorhodospira halophila TaxID=1053 RepID=UPI0019142D8C|nr:response regulator transcription factor [Halorhodospira halophila]MBK5937655.1 hypothetical protein [Halorhodospira halophila]